MKNSAAELKAVAKAIGASLDRSGHPVPHTAVLNAVASALNKRNWNTLAGTASAMPTPTAPQVPAPASREPEYTRGTWFLLQLAYTLGFGTPPQGLFREPDVRTWALQKTRGVVSGVLKWGGWNLPAELDLKTCTLDASEFAPESNGVARGEFLVRPVIGEQFAFPVSHSASTGWVLSTDDTDKVMTDMAQRVPPKLLMDLGLGRLVSAVPAFMETDDRVMRVDFDAAGFLAKATSAQICAVLNAGGDNSEATDDVAQWEQSHGAAREEISRMQSYLEELQRSPECETGFHCSVDIEAMLTWLETFRPVVLAHALCEHQDVRLQVCDDAAALDAMTGLNLLAAVRNQLG